MTCAIVLAAGLSRRMGVQKLLLPFGSETVISHIVREILDSRVDTTFVVVGHDGDRVAAALASLSVTIVPNPNHEDGMLTSVRRGLRALPTDCETILVTLGDLPGITSHLVDQLLGKFSNTDKGILVPLHDGTRGHPLVFSSQYKAEILTQFDDEGLRGLLRAHPDDLAELDVSSPDVLSDIDFPRDYLRALDQVEKREQEVQ